MTANIDMLSDGFFHHIIINFFVCLTQNRFSFSSRVRVVRFQQPAGSPRLPGPTASILWVPLV